MKGKDAACAHWVHQCCAVPAHGEGMSQCVHRPACSGAGIKRGGHLTHRSNRVILENGKGTINNYTGIYGPPAEMAFGVWD